MKKQLTGVVVGYYKEMKLIDHIKNVRLRKYLIANKFDQWTIEEYEMKRKHVKLEARMDIDKELYE